MRRRSLGISTILLDILVLIDTPPARGSTSAKQYVNREAKLLAEL